MLPAQDIFLAEFFILCGVVLVAPTMTVWALFRSRYRRWAREGRVSRPIRVSSPDDGLPDELRDILDEELARLPARHRGPIVLCELEGLSRPEAARRLGIPEGTLSSRLARAKARLRDRLASRGVALPVAAIAAILLREARAAALPLYLLESTVEAAASVAAGPIAAVAVSAPVASLYQGVIKTMLVGKLKGIALAVGAMTAFVSGAVVLAQSGQLGANTNNPGAATKGWTRTDPDGQAAALEKKLDRVLEALERISGTEDARLAGRPGAAPKSPPEDLNRPLVPAPRVAKSHNIGECRIDTGLVGAVLRRTRRASEGIGRTGAPGRGSDPRWRVGSVSAEDPSPARTAAGSRPGHVATESNIGQFCAAFKEDAPDARPLSDRLQAVEQRIQGMLQRLERVEEQLKPLDARIGGGRGRRWSIEAKK